MHQQQIQNHKLTGIQYKIQRGMSIHSNTLTPYSNIDSDSSTPVVRASENDTPMPSWDAAALHIITFLSSRINPNVGVNGGLDTGSWRRCI